MTLKKKYIAQELAEVYESASKNTSHSDELNPILGKLIEKSKQNHLEGKGISHEDATRKIKERYPFLK